MGAAPDLDALVLAAGRASRMGLPKALLPAGPGHTLLSRLAALALDVVDGDLVVVVGSEAELVEAEVARIRRASVRGAGRIETVLNRQHGRGQGTSLALGVGRVRAEGALVLLADQPALADDRLARLVDAWRDRAAHVVAVAASSGGRQRTPVVLGRAVFPDIVRLDGDEGARRILRGRPSDLQLVEWGEGPWESDIDTWDDYVRLARTHGWDAEAPARHDRTPLRDRWAAIAASGLPPGDAIAGLRQCVLAALATGRDAKRRSGRG